MVRVQNLLGLQNVHLARRRLRPRKHCQPLDVIPRQRVVDRHRIHPAQPPKLLQRVLLGLLRHPRRFNLLLQLRNVFLRLVQVAQLLLDRLQLFAQIVVPLRRLHRILHLGLDLVAQLLHLDLLRQVLVDPLQPRRDIRRFQQLLLVRRGQERQRRRDKVRQPPRFLNVDRNRLQVVRKRRRRTHNLLELAHHIALQRLRLRRRHRLNLFHRLALRGHKRAVLGKLAQPHPLVALGKNKQALVRHLHHFMHRRARANVVQVRSLRRVLPGVPLRHHQNRLLLAQRLDQQDRALPPHRQRQHRMGKQHCVPHRKHRNRTARDRNRRRIIVNPCCSWLDHAYKFTWHGISLSVLISDFLHWMHP